MDGCVFECARGELEERGVSDELLERVAQAVNLRRSATDYIVLATLAALCPGDEVGSGLRVWSAEHSWIHAHRKLAAEEMRKACLAEVHRCVGGRHMTPYAALVDVAEGIRKLEIPNNVYSRTKS